MVVVNDAISNATMRNWSRLGTKSSDRLKSRANKRMSSKIIIPIEYFSNTNNVKLLQKFVDFVAGKKWNISDIVLSVAVNILKKKSLYDKSHVRKVLKSIDSHVIPEIEDYPLPLDEKDLLGLVYQSLLSEGDKNRKGSYYTPYSITSNMTSGLDFSNDQTFYDPCCGSGAFILSLEGVNPQNVYASDNDPVAVTMTKLNMLLKFSDFEFEPQVFQIDYLQDGLFSNGFDIPTNGFSYIISNPPWGAMITDNSLSTILTSKESFSYFFVKAYRQLRDGGFVKFLLPESVLNVKCHKDLRNFILNNGNLKEISLYSGSFTGVLTKYVDICLEKKTPTECVKVYENGTVVDIEKKSFYDTDGLVYNLLSKDDIDIIHKVKNIGVYNLKGSSWALGIVTGDNKGKLKEVCEDGMEPIYTGKEIESCKLKTPRNYITYDRKKFQQVAKDEYYRASEKLVYKFISKRLVFAYDDKGSLFLNSANILIPNIPGMSIKTVMAFLNSELYQYMYMSIFGELKVLRSNLEELPFPMITHEQDVIIVSMVDDIMAARTNVNDKLQRYIYDLFGINESEINHIKSTIWKN